MTTRGQFITYGINQITNKVCDGLSMHSEVSAFKNLQKLIKNNRINPKHFRKGFIMINYAFTYGSGKLRISKPCCHCQKFLKRNEKYFKTIWYSTSDGIFEQL